MTSCFSGCFSSLPGVRCDRWAGQGAGGQVVITVCACVRFDSIKSEGSTVAADQFFLSHADCDNRVSVQTV